MVTRTTLSRPQPRAGSPFAHQPTCAPHRQESSDAAPDASETADV